MKKLILLFILTTFIGSVAAQDYFNTITSSGNTLENHSPEAIVDGDNSTSGRFYPGETIGWFKIPLGSKFHIKSLEIDGIIPEDTLSYVEYNVDGYIKTFPSSFLRDINGQFTLDLSEDDIVTDELTIRFEGNNLDNVVINEVHIKKAEPGSFLELKKLIILKDSVSSSGYTGAQHLIDGLIGTVWRAWKNENWGKSNSFVLEDLNTIYPHIKEQSPWETGFAVLKPEIIDTYDSLKMFVDHYAIGSLDIMIKSTTTNGTILSLNLAEHLGTWVDIPLNQYGIISEIKLFAKSRENTFAGIGELQLLGYKNPEVLNYIDIIPFTAEEVNDTSFVVESLNYSDTYRLDVLVDQKNNKKVKSFLNNIQIVENEIQDINGFTRYRYLLDDRYLIKGVNFFKYESSVGQKVLQASIVKVKNSIKLDLIHSELSDKRLYSGSVINETVLDFVDGEASVDKVRVYYKEYKPQGLYLINGLTKVFPQVSTENTEYLEYEVDGNFKQVALVDPLGATEVVVYGNPNTITKPFIKIVYPSHNESLEVQIPTYKPIWGVTDSPDSLITVDGLKAKVYGNYFWIDNNGNKVYDTGFHTIEAKLTADNGEVIKDEISVYVQSNTHEFTLNQEDREYYTRDDYFNLSGVFNPWNSKLYINDVEVTSNTMDFSYDFLLSDGLNIINIELKDKQGRNTKEIHLRKVYKQYQPLTLSITSPGHNYISSEDFIDVTGYATPQGLVDIKVNGIPATVSEGRFKAVDVPLLADENTIIVESLYNDNVTVVKSIKVLKDTIPPEILDVTPGNDTWFGTSDVTISGKIIEANGYTVFINKVKADITTGQFSLTIPIKEVKNSVAIVAKDRAGNVTEYPVFNINADFTKPENFTIFRSHETWTNNKRPILTFDAVDSYSGISHYEVSVDGSKFIRQESPFQTPFLDDGEISIIVRAYDKVGNYRDSKTTLYIDTTPPDEPTDFRAVPGNGSITLKWSEEDNETIAYKIVDRDKVYTINRDQFTRQNDDKTTDYYKYKVSNLTNGDSYSFSAYAIDRAGNIGRNIVDTAIAGITSEKYNEEEGNVVEFENTVLIIPKNSLPEEVAKVVIAEVESQDLLDQSINPVVSPILNFSIIKNDNTELEHVSFSERFIGKISYDETLIPDGIPEDHLGVYYFDENWSRWILIEESGVDMERNEVYFTTDHFTSFSVQPTVFEDLSIQELTDVEFSPFSSKISHKPVTVSTQGGGASTSMTELYLPGKNGFDFELRRIYDTSTAKGDSSGLSVNLSISIEDVINNRVGDKLLGSLVSNVQQHVLNSIKKYLQNNGDYSYALGQGWRLNLPYIRGHNGGILVRTPSGSFYDIASMSIDRDKSILAGLYRKVIFKNNEGEDFILEVNQARIDYTASKTVGPFEIGGWQLLGGKLILKDGSSYHFDELGRFINSSDPTGMNTVRAEYSGLLLKKITDSMGRVIRFGYTEDFNSTLIPQIDEIWIENDPLHRKITYTYDNPGNMKSELNIIDPAKLPLLKTAKDIKSRTWSYDYDFNYLFTGEIGAEVNGISVIAMLISPSAAAVLNELFGISVLKLNGRSKNQWIFPMDHLSGPGIGQTDINYHKTTLTYFNISGGDYFLGLFPTSIKGDLGMEQRALVDRLVLSIDDRVIRTENYSYDFTFSGHKQFYNKSTIKDDGKLKEVNRFYSVTKRRKTVFDWSDYILSMVGDKINPFRESIYRYDVIPLNHRTEYYDSRDGSFISAVQKGYNEHNLRPNYIKQYSSDKNFTQQFIEFDSWGNKTKISNESNLDGRNTKSITHQHYNSSNYKASVGWNSSKFGVSSSLRSWLYPRHNQLLASKTINYNSYDNTSVVIEKYNNYNDIGQLSSSLLNTENGWAETKYEYGYDDSIMSELDRRASFGFPKKLIIDFPSKTISDLLGSIFIGDPITSYHTLSGELTKVIAPNGQITTNEYDFSNSRVYTVRETFKGIKNIENNLLADVSTFKGYDRVMGYLMWSTDGNGYTTEYNFDEIGRRTKIVYPDDDDNRFWNPVVNPTDSTRSNNPTTVISYDDVNLIVTETERNGSVTTYQYDNLTRLKTISKLNGSHISKFEHDGRNNITKYTDPNGAITNFSYNPQDMVELEEYLETNKAVDLGGVPLQRSRKTNYSYLDKGIIEVNEKGIEVKSYYDFNNNVIKKTYLGKYGEIVSNELFYYDGLNNLVATVDAKGNVTTNKYNSRNQVINTTLPEALYYSNDREYNISAYTNISYDIAGNKVSQIVGGQGLEEFKTTFIPDGLGRTISETSYFTDLDGNSRTTTTKYVFDNNGNLLRTIDPRGKVWSKEYYARNNVKAEIDPLGNSTTYVYDLSDRLVSMTDPRENSGAYPNLDFTISYQYDDLDRIVEAKLPARLNRATNTLDTKPVIKFDYDLLGNVLKRTEIDGGTTTYSYSERKRVLTETKSGSDKNEGTVSYTTRFEYDPVGNLVKKIMPDGNSYQSFTYDIFNRVESETVNDESVTSYRYDLNGNRISIKNPNGFNHSYSYDSLNRLETETDYNWKVTDYKYDLLGNVSYLKDSIGNVYKSEYNQINKLIKEINGRNKVKRYYYDAAGNLVKDIDANGTVGNYIVLANNLLGSITYTSSNGTNSQHIDYSYDEAGGIKSVTDSGITTKNNYINGVYTPDPYDQLFNSETVGYSSVSYDYDYMNRMTNMSYNSGINLDLSYNNLSQLESITGFVDAVTYTNNGHMEKVSFNNGVILDYTYTDRLELGSIKYNNGLSELKSFEYVYDLAGNITEENKNYYGYDGKNQLTTAMLSSGAAEEEYELTEPNTGEAVSDIMGEKALKEVALENEDYNVDWGAKSFGLDLNYSYRVKRFVLNRNSLDAHRVTPDNIAIFYSNYNREKSYIKADKFSYSEDPITGNITITFEKAIFGRYFKIHSHFNDMDAEGNSLKIDSTLSLDRANPVTVFAVTGGRNEFYTLDNKGNRVKRTIMSKTVVVDDYTYYDGSDLLRTDSKFAYIYDDNGNLIKKGSNFEEVEGEELSINPVGEYFEYTYDLKNRLVKVMKYDEVLQNVVLAATYVYDSNNYRIEKTNKDGVKTNFVFDLFGNCIEEVTPTSTTSYVFMNNRHIAKVVDNKKYFYGVNNVGSTVLLTDEAGNAVWNGDITPYGDKQDTTGQITEDVKYTGKHLDPDTGLYYFNARWYDSNLGRFITEDPIKDGNNWYVYCQNNPIRYIDPTGLYTIFHAQSIDYSWYYSFQPDTGFASNFYRGVISAAAYMPGDLLARKTSDVVLENMNEPEDMRRVFDSKKMENKEVVKDTVIDGVLTFVNSIKGLFKGIKVAIEVNNVVSVGKESISSVFTNKAENSYEDFLEISGYNTANLLSGAKNDEDAISLSSLYTDLVDGYEDSDYAKYENKKGYSEDIIVPQLEALRTEIVEREITDNSSE